MFLVQLLSSLYLFHMHNGLVKMTTTTTTKLSRSEMSTAPSPLTLHDEALLLFEPKDSGSNPNLHPRTPIHNQLLSHKHSQNHNYDRSAQHTFCHADRVKRKIISFSLAPGLSSHGNFLMRRAKCFGGFGSIHWSMYKIYHMYKKFGL